MSPSAFFRLRWHGQVPLSVLLWRDMACVGTVINLGASFLGLAALAQGVHGGIAAALHLAPLPYNVFLLAAVLRRQDSDTVATLVAVAWFVVVLVI